MTLNFNSQIQNTEHLNKVMYLFILFPSYSLQDIFHKIKFLTKLRIPFHKLLHKTLFLEQRKKRSQIISKRSHSH